MQNQLALSLLLFSNRFYKSHYIYAMLVIYILTCDAQLCHICM